MPDRSARNRAKALCHFAQRARNFAVVCLLLFFSLALPVQAAMSVTGTPPTTVNADQLYAFRPTFSGPRYGTLVFEIVNKPVWAVFSVFSGQLIGTPKPNDGGTYNNIRISVTDGKTRVVLRDFSITVRAPSQPRSLTISWEPPARNTDGTTITDLAGYRIYLGRSKTAMTPRATITNPGVSRYFIEPVDSGQHYVAVTAFNKQGHESTLSEVIPAWIN